MSMSGDSVRSFPVTGADSSHLPIALAFTSLRLAATPDDAPALSKTSFLMEDWAAVLPYGRTVLVISRLTRCISPSNGVFSMRMFPVCPICENPPFVSLAISRQIGVVDACPPHWTVFTTMSFLAAMAQLSWYFTSS